MVEVASDLRSRVESYSGRLSRLDRQVVEALLANPLAASYETAREVGERAGVHQTTVIRFARKLGYDGYLEMRESLRKGHAEKASSASRIFSRIRRSGALSAAETFLQVEIEALHQLPNHVRTADLEKAAALLAAARHILVFARGQATVLGEFLAMRLARLGFDICVIRHVDTDTPEAVANLQKEDIFVSFALRRVPAQLPLLLAFCEERNIRSIVISDMIGPSIRPSPHLLLAASRGTETEWQTLSVPMAICNLLLLELVQARPEQATEALGRLDQAREDLASISGDVARRS